MSIPVPLDASAGRLEIVEQPFVRAVSSPPDGHVVGSDHHIGQSKSEVGKRGTKVRHHASHAVRPAHVLVGQMMDMVGGDKLTRDLQAACVPELSEVPTDHALSRGHRTS
jgi:hypothetical protein